MPSLLSSTFHAIRSFWWPTIEIEVDEPALLVLDDNGWPVIADRSNQTVTRNGRLVGKFADIRAISLRHFQQGSGQRRREWWSVAMQMVDHSTVPLGRTRDSLDASIAGARLGTITGKQIVALSQAGMESTGLS